MVSAKGFSNLRLGLAEAHLFLCFDSCSERPVRISLTSKSKSKCETRMDSLDKWLLPEGVEELLPAEAHKLETLRRRLLDLYEIGRAHV